MIEKKIFFSDESNVSQIRRLGISLRDRVNELDDDDKNKSVAYNLNAILEMMVSYPAHFDENASQNIEWIGESFLEEVRAYWSIPEADKNNYIKSLFTEAYRFLSEVSFFQAHGNSFELNRINKYVEESLDFFQGHDRSQLIYAAYQMPGTIVREMLRSPSIIEFRKFSESIESARKHREEWDKENKAQKNLLDGLSERIKDLISSYNFVGLAHGFQNLKSGKERELIRSLVFLFVLGAFAVLPPIFEIGFVLWHFETIEMFRTPIFYLLPAIIAFEVFVIYFFRVVLAQYKSLKAQVLQIELRLSLCQFIESYSSKVSAIRKNDPQALAKFESLIFSNLVADQTAIPSTFDGVEQLGNLFSQLKGG